MTHARLSRPGIACRLSRAPDPKCEIFHVSANYWGRLSVRAPSSCAATQQQMLGIGQKAKYAFRSRLAPLNSSQICCDAFSRHLDYLARGIQGNSSRMVAFAFEEARAGASSLLLGRVCFVWSRATRGLAASAYAPGTPAVATRNVTQCRARVRRVAAIKTETSPISRRELNLTWTRGAVCDSVPTGNQISRSVLSIHRSH